MTSYFFLLSQFMWSKKHFSSCLRMLLLVFLQRKRAFANPPRWSQQKLWNGRRSEQRWKRSEPSGRRMLCPACLDSHRRSCWRRRRSQKKSTWSLLVRLLSGVCKGLVTVWCECTFWYTYLNFLFHILVRWHQRKQKVINNKNTFYASDFVAAF